LFIARNGLMPFWFGFGGGLGALPVHHHEFLVAFCFFRSLSDLAYCRITSNNSLIEVG
jgi:hypothetical protein